MAVAAAVRRREACLRAHAVEYFTHPAVCVVLFHSSCECCHLLVALIPLRAHADSGEFSRLAFQRGEFLLHRLPAECTDIGFSHAGRGFRRVSPAWLCVRGTTTHPPNSRLQWRCVAVSRCSVRRTSAVSSAERKYSVGMPFIDTSFLLTLHHNGAAPHAPCGQQQRHRNGGDDGEQRPDCQQKNGFLMSFSWHNIKQFFYSVRNYK